MSAPAKKEDLPEIRKEGSPPGPARWCANCVHFRPGPIVVQGNTLGGCFVGQDRSGGEMSPSEAYRIFEQGQRARQPREVTANDHCAQHRLRTGVAVL